MDIDFCPELEDLLKSRHAVGASGQVFENVVGTSTPNNLHILQSLMGAKPKRTLETGFAFGASCLTFTALHRRNGAKPAQQHVAIDPMQGTLFDSAGLRAIERAGLAGYLDFRGETSALAMADLLRQGLKFDLIYLDGSHFFEEVLIDAYYATRLLNDGGVMLFDDSTIPDVAKVLRYLRRNQAHCLTEMDLGPFHPSGRSIKYRLARRLGRAQLTAFRRHGSTEGRDWHLRVVDF
jgi:predicted O-methyltransferase YrrM